MVLLVVLMALVMFYLAEIAEAYFGEPKQREISWRPHNIIKIAAASLVLVALAAFILSMGQPTALEKWDLFAG